MPSNKEHIVPREAHRRDGARGKVHEYLGMTMDFRREGICMLISFENVVQND